MTQCSPASGGGALLYDKNRPSDRALYDCASGGEPCCMKRVAHPAQCALRPRPDGETAAFRQGRACFLSKPVPENVIIMFPNVSDA